MADIILVSGEDSSTGNVTGGRKARPLWFKETTAAFPGLSGSLRLIAVDRLVWSVHGAPQKPRNATAGGKSCRTRANQRVSFVEGEGPRLDALKDPAALQILWPAIDHAMSSCDINRKMLPRSI
jgi:hypothetical protein